MSWFSGSNAVFPNLKVKESFIVYDFLLRIDAGCTLEHKTCDILAAERLQLMRFDNRLIIESFQKAICVLKW